MEWTSTRRAVRRRAAAGLAAWAILAWPSACSAGPEASGGGEPAAVRGDSSGQEQEPEPGAAGDGGAQAGRAPSLRSMHPNAELVLLLGFDGPMTPPGRTDAILVLALDAASGQIAVVSVPRDLWVDIPGLEPGRINTVYRIAEARLGRGAGHRLLREVLDEELGIEVSHTIAVDMKGFGEIIDILGGVFVDVDCPIRDNFVSPESPTGFEPLVLERGRQRLDGRTALLYSRSRHGTSDLDRSRRQQSVLVGVWRKIARLETVGRLPALWNRIAAHVRTDLDLGAALAYASIIAGAGLGDIHGLVLVEPIVYQWRSPDGRSVLLVDKEKLHAAFARLFEAPKPGKRLEPTCRPADAALHWKDKRNKDAGPDPGDAGP